MTITGPRCWDARAGRGDRSLGISTRRRSLRVPSRTFDVGAARLCVGLRLGDRALGRIELLLRSLELIAPRDPFVARLRERRFGAVQIGAGGNRALGLLRGLLCRLRARLRLGDSGTGAAVDCGNAATDGDGGTLIVMAVRISSPPPSGTSTNRPARRSTNALVSPITACTAVTSVLASIGCPARIATRAPAVATSRIAVRTLSSTARRSALDCTVCAAPIAAASCSMGAGSSWTMLSSTHAVRLGLRSALTRSASSRRLAARSCLTSASRRLTNSSSGPR